MKAVSTLLAIVSAMVLVLVGGTSDAWATQEPVLVSAGIDVEHLSTDGVTVVWSGYGSSGHAHDIYAVRLSDHQEFLVASDQHWKRHPDIDGSTIVWEQSLYDCPTCEVRILAKNLTTGAILEVAQPGGVAQPVISGNIIVWVDGPRIKARDISTMAEAVVLAMLPEPNTQDTVFLGPEIDGDRVVWLEQDEPFDADAGFRWRLRSVSIGSGEPWTVAEGQTSGGQGGVVPGFFDLAGNILVYGLEGDITVLDLATGHRRQFTAGIGGVETDGRYVFVPSVYNGQPPDLLGYDLLTDSRFIVNVGQGFARPLTAENGVLAWALSTGNPRDYEELHVANVAIILPSARRSAPDTISPNNVYFPETGHYLGHGFKAFWETNGGVPVFGYPLTEEFSEQNPDTAAMYTVQYFERQRFEWHPEHAGTPYEVLLGRLGVELLIHQGRDWTMFPKGDPSTAHYMPETGHAIAEPFWGYWSSHGLELGDPGVSFRESLALFGYPLSGPLTETNVDGDTVLTQYFERAVFEYHPTNPAPYMVLLRRLGADMLAARDW